MGSGSARRRAPSYVLPVATGVLAAGLFIADTFTHLEIAVGVLYSAVVMLAVRFCTPRGVLLVAAGCVFLIVSSFFLTPSPETSTAGEINLLIGIATIAVTTILVLQAQAAESTLRERASLLDLTHDTVFSRGMDDRITYWNLGAEELYGSTRSEALGKVSHELLRTKFPAALREIMADLERDGRWEGELVHTKRDGAAVTVSSRWFLQRDERGHPALILETNTDITERRRVEEALDQARSDLARANRVLVLGEMTASIAHEIKQPIAATLIDARAGLRWLAKNPPDLDEVRQTLEHIVQDGNRANEVIGRVRALVKKEPPQKNPLDLNDAIREVLALTDREVQRSKVTLETRLSSVPVVRANRIQVQQVILNLVVNALDAMDGLAGRARELTIVSGGDGSKDVFVEVHDTGIGLDPADTDRLFQSFYTTKPGGMGMGLPISRSIVRAHGGELSASRNEPYGAIFRFTLPADERRDEEPGRGEVS